MTTGTGECPGIQAPAGSEDAADLETATRLLDKVVSYDAFSDGEDNTVLVSDEWMKAADAVVKRTVARLRGRRTR
jgi:enamine deaminase RidA (YjgF/YER057c/UK114 family)